MKDLPELWAHQKLGIERARDVPEFALFFSMGTGKTRTLIEILRAKFNESKRVMRTLILAPPIVLKNWVEEWKMYSKIEPRQITPLLGPGKKRLETFLARSQDTGHIFVTNYESLLMGDLFRAIYRWNPEVLVLDESHKCKTPNSQRTKKSVLLSDTSTFRYLLSGTPVLNSPMDLFSQFLILDKGGSFGKNFFTFRARFFRDKNAGMPKDRHFPNWVVMPGALEAMNKILQAKSMTVEKKDCMDLPPFVRQVIKVPMGKEQAKAYAEMKKDFITFIDGDAVTAQLAIVKGLRLQQLASGYATTVDGEEKAFDATPKQDALKELLSELTPHHKVLVWACWRQNYAQIRRVCEDLGIGYTEVHGDIPGTQKYNNIDTFTNDPKCRVFIGHPGSGGIGVNLVQASYSIFFSRNFSLEQSLQAEARNYRGGSEIHQSITRIDLVSEGTIDEIICEALADKFEIGEKLLRGLPLELTKLEKGIKNDG